MGQARDSRVRPGAGVLIWPRLAFALPVASFAASSAIAQQSEKAPIAGYFCEVGVRSATEPSATAKLAADGSVREVHWRWWQRVEEFSLLTVSVHGTTIGSFPEDIGGSYASVGWSFLLPNGHEKAKVRIELRASPDVRQGHPPPFASEYSRGNEKSLVAAWADLLTFARGTDILYALVRDKHGKVLVTKPFPTAATISAVDEMDTILASLRNKIGSYQQECVFSDGLEPAIIVT